ncbi:MAG: glycosyltransferase [Oscillospiraceae bacterium]|nr:glycosyltransferase [Oscillospiraceae bacterium]
MERVPKLAVIIPAYNDEAVIARTLNSVAAQSFRDMEVIVVNDGSTDRTASIIETLAREDPRIRLVNTENGGPALARNRGLDCVTPGVEWLTFVDSDDELAPNALERLLEGAGPEADLVLCGFTIFNPDGTTNDYFEQEKRLSRRQLGRELVNLYKANLLNQVWAKLFRAELIARQGLRFQDLRWGEDRLFIYDCLACAQTVAVLPDCLYRYIMHPGESLTTRYYDKKLEICFRAGEGMEQLRLQLGAPEDGCFSYMFLKNIWSCMVNLYDPSCPLTRREKRDYMRALLADGRIQAHSRTACGGPAVRLLCLALRTRSVSLNLAAAKIMTLVSRLAPKLFLKLKHKK